MALYYLFHNLILFWHSFFGKPNFGFTTLHNSFNFSVAVLPVKMDLFTRLSNTHKWPWISMWFACANFLSALSLVMRAALSFCAWKKAEQSCSDRLGFVARI